MANYIDIIGKVYESNSFGKFIVFNDSKTVNNIKYYKIMFLETKYEGYYSKQCILSGQVKDNLYPVKDFIMKPNDSNGYGQFIVYPNFIYDEVQKRYRYLIKFITTGYETYVCPKEIRTKMIKDPFYPSIFNRAYLGNAKKSDNKQLYAIWFAILNRCYNLENPQYKYYGEKGVHVSDEWLCFETFLSEIKEVEGFNQDLIAHNGLHLDKDKKQIGVNQKVYSKETCTWISSFENCSTLRSIKI